MKIIVSAILACMSAAAQTQPPAFEAASIHVSEPGQRNAEFHSEPGTLNIRNITLRSCLEWAYGLGPLQISGPAWLDDLRLDILARSENRTADDDRLRLMLQALLADRFGLKVHYEKREQPIYALRLAKGGPKFHAKGTKDGSTFVESTGDGSSRFSEDRTGAMAERVTMPQLADKLSVLLDRVIIDRTALQGRYDFRVDIRPYLPAEAGGKPDVMSILFAGLNDQLGLKLEAGKEPVDLLVIDTINKTPTAN